MKITEAHTHVLSPPLDAPFAFSTGWATRLSTMVVGESLFHGQQPPEIAAAIVQSALAPIVIGQDPFDVWRYEQKR